MESARRAALDHVLQLIARAPWSDGLVLRGSMTLQAWAGDAAREPGDLDWIVHTPGPADCPDPLSPFPYVDTIETVQQWPEASDGAARYEIWGEEEFSAYGARPLLPPEGLRWLDAPALGVPASPLQDLIEAIREHPAAAGGVTLDPDGVRGDDLKGYDGDVSYDDRDEESEYDMPGVRAVIPWQAPGSLPGRAQGEIQVDFALDEVLHDAPVWTAVPRGDGGPPTAVRTASRELSLAWKLLWLITDHGKDGSAGGKDLYDAVLLAECPHTRLTPRLLRKVLGSHAADFGPGSVRTWHIAASCPGDPDRLKERLVRALGPVFSAG
ncbi:nucleotidyl transferase AbiEii/AbiGii toxin family protein [Streptomyces sp. NPDC002187]|uniref:nucleotidyl transferase AbiEii/AbiGii toxin family protein n=1 Tax=Streptomyces sp. NPDC002187 TaxID=3364637 RepID=UPI0036AC4668